MSLLLEGGWMAFNAKAYLDPIGEKITPLASSWREGPGTIERDLTLAAMRRFVCLVGIVWLVSDLSTRPVWRRRIWITISLTGLSIVLFGLIERVLRAPMIFWETDRTSSTFFSTYFYHANAGAFINLVLPLTAGLALAAAAQKPKPQLRLAFWSAATLVTISGAFVNFSRGAQATTLILLLMIGVWQLREKARRKKLVWQRLLLAVGLVILLALPLVLLGWNSTATRWVAFPQDLSTDGRHFASRVTLRMAADAGAFGFGPGTFRIGFPFYIAANEHPETAGFWRYAHEDYLQTYVEWGWFGSILWAGLLGGGLITGLRSYFNGRRRLAASDRILLFTSSLALVGVALHSLVDFPLQIASLQLYTAVYLGLGWGSRRWYSRNPDALGEETATGQKSRRAVSTFSRSDSARITRAGHPPLLAIEGDLSP